MERFKRTLLTGGSLIRVVRLLMSAFIIYRSIAEKNWLVGWLGAVLLYQVVANTGCCAEACFSPDRKRPHYHRNTNENKDESARLLSPSMPH